MANLNEATSVLSRIARDFKSVIALAELVDEYAVTKNTVEALKEDVEKHSKERKQLVVDMQALQDEISKLKQEKESLEQVAGKIVAKAETEAKKVVTNAATTAEKIVSDAKAKANGIVEAAEKRANDAELRFFEFEGKADIEEKRLEEVKEMIRKLAE